MTAAVRIRDLRYRYRGGDADVLRLGTLEIDGPGLVAVVGRTGVGKTTLMELLAGTLREPYQGSMQVLGVELRTLAETPTASAISAASASSPRTSGCSPEPASATSSTRTWSTPRSPRSTMRSGWSRRSTGWDAGLRRP